MSVGARIKTIRDNLDITQAVFADRLGTARNTIANYEIGRREPKDATIKAICREFNVNENWLRTGKGEMFDDTSNIEIERLARELSLDDFLRGIVTSYLELDAGGRKAVQEFVRKLNENGFNQTESPHEQSNNEDIIAKIEKLQQQNEELIERVKFLEEEADMEDTRNGIA